MIIDSFDDGGDDDDDDAKDGGESLNVVPERSTVVDGGASLKREEWLDLHSSQCFATLAFAAVQADG